MMENSIPNEGLYIVLGYLGVYELVCMRMVCRSVREAVDKDILQWGLTNLTVSSPPLNMRITDHILTTHFSSFANGRLTTLALIHCPYITDHGLLCIIHNNPNISKLYVPSCTGLTPDGVIEAVKFLTEQGRQNSMSLKISGIYNTNKQHLAALHSYLHMNPSQRRNDKLYPDSFKDSSVFGCRENESPIDVDACPECDEVRTVFRCSLEACERKARRGLRECRGCYFCVERCEECGKCVEFEEEMGKAACVDVLCLDCWIKLPKCCFCNSSYCTRHASQGSTEFVCGVCQDKFVHHNHYDHEVDM